MNQETPISDRNIERLLGTAYRPEAVDPAFAQNVEERLLCAAQQLAQSRAKPAAELPTPAETMHLARLRRRLGWAMTLAASVAVCALVWYANSRLNEPRAKENFIPTNDLATVTFPAHEPGNGLTPRPRPAAEQAKPLAIGATLTTRATERRRVTLADGSILYLNQNTIVEQIAARQLKLLQGEIYLEVNPQAPGRGTPSPEGSSPGGETFLIATPDRTVTALGTRFAVRVEHNETGVLVTQGKVQVSGVDRFVEAGQQVTVGGQAVTQAPRVSHLLDWTRELMAAACSPLVPGSKHVGGALIAVDPNGQEVQLTLRKYIIDVHIEDGFARTTIDQTYFNEKNWRLEGTFYFPLPPDATLSRLAMYVENGQCCELKEGGMVERDLARNVYEEIRYTNRDPALLEWVDGSTFKMRVFPLEARKEKRVLLSYTQRLPMLYGALRYRFPGGHNMELVRDWSFKAVVKNGAKYSVTSASHPTMDIKPAGNDFLAQTSAQNIKPNQDVTLEIHEIPGQIGQRDNPKPRGEAIRGTPKPQGEVLRTLGVFADKSRYSKFIHKEGDQYLMLRFQPDLVSAQPKRQRRDWVFLFESGANRDPLLARVQIDVIRTLLENAEHDDTFSILTAGTRVRLFDKEPHMPTARTIDEAVKFLEATHLIGALDLEKALHSAVTLLAQTQNPHLVHVGAGVAAMGERREEVLARILPTNVRYVGVGVGKRWSRAFMKMAAERTSGLFTQINPDEPIGWRAFELLATLNTPRLLELQVVPSDLASRERKRPEFLTETTSLSQGEELCAIARFAKNEPLPTSLSVTGKIDGVPYTKTVVVENIADNAGYLPRQWAKLEIDRLLAEDGARNKKTIIELSKASYVMSPFTSLLVLETDADYERFKVDPGRKDHWALYECEPKIKTVYEPENVGRPAAAKDEQGSPQSVLKSILVRAPAAVSIHPLRDNVPATNAWEIYAGAYALYLHVPDGGTVLLGGLKVTADGAIKNRGGVVYSLGRGGFELDARRLARFGLRVEDVTTVVNTLTHGKLPLSELVEGEKAIDITLRMPMSLGSTMAIGSGDIRALLGANRTGLSSLGTAAPAISDPFTPFYMNPYSSGLIGGSSSTELFGGFGYDASKRPDKSNTAAVAKDLMRTFIDGSSNTIVFVKRPPALRKPADPNAFFYDGVLPLDALEQLIKEKDPAKVGQIYVRGNDVTQDRVILRLLNLYPGQTLRYPNNLDDEFKSAKDTIAALETIIKEQQRIQVITEQVTDKSRILRWQTELVRMERLFAAGVVDKQVLDEVRNQYERASGGDLFMLPEFSETYKFRLRHKGLRGLEALDVHSAYIDPETLALMEFERLLGTPADNLIYKRPKLSLDQRAFSDLLQYAPGLNTNETDILGVLEAELTPDTGWLVKPSHIDPGARALIDKARSLGWSCLTLGDNKDPLKVYFNGAGQFCCERTLSTGLVEQVYCDGTTRIDLYPELGLGARRSVQRFQRGALADLVPWHLLPADDLARAAHVKLVDERTVALVPRHENPQAEVRLLFAKEGSLSERQLVKLPSGKILYRETYDEHGTIRYELAAQDAAAKPHTVTRKLNLAAASAPNLRPDTSKLVMVPMPLRTGEFLRGRLKGPRFPTGYPRPTSSMQEHQGAPAKLSDDEAIRLIAADCLEGNGWTAFYTFGERFQSKGDNRLGFYTLLTAAQLFAPNGTNPHVQPRTVKEWGPSTTMFSIHLEHPGNPLARYLSHVNLAMVARFDKFDAVGELPGPQAAFVPRLAGFFDHYMLWHTDRYKESAGDLKKTPRERTLAYIKTCPSAVHAWILLDLLESRGVAADGAYHLLAADVYERFGKETGLLYVARYERARSLWQAGERTRAMTLFRELHGDALKAGVLPLIDITFVQALKSDPTKSDAIGAPQPTGAGDWFTQVTRDASAQFVKEKRLQTNLLLAWQLWQLGQAELSNEVYDATMSTGQELVQDIVKELRKAVKPAAEKNVLLLQELEQIMQVNLLQAGLDHLWRTNQWARAEVLLHKLLEDRRIAQQPSLWRLGRALAQKRSDVARIIVCQERALDLEFQHLPEAVNLETIRKDYGDLLQHYQQVATALKVLQTAPPQDFLAKVVKAADRWRSLDPEATNACQQTARILQTVGARDLAWDYLTTPIGLKPNEAGPWLNLASTLAADGEYELADRAYVTAFQAEPTNAQILWDRAHHLKQMGRVEQANQVFRQIAEGSWQPRFQGLQGQARAVLNRN